MSSQHSRFFRISEQKSGVICGDQLGPAIGKDPASKPRDAFVRAEEVQGRDPAESADDFGRTASICRSRKVGRPPPRQAQGRDCSADGTSPRSRCRPVRGELDGLDDLLFRSCPASPTKGSPWRFSSRPGPSTMNISSAFGFPTPKTMVVRFSESRQRAHSPRSARICFESLVLPRGRGGGWLRRSRYEPCAVRKSEAP